MKTLLITSEDIRTVVNRVGIDTLMDLTIARLTEAFKELSLGIGELRPRAGFCNQQSSSVLEWMPYKRDIDQSVSIKVVAYQPSNITYNQSISWLFFLALTLPHVGSSGICRGEIHARVDYLTCFRHF